MKQKRRTLDSLRLLPLLALWPVTALAAPALQSHQSILDMAVAHVEEREAQFAGKVQVTALSLDRRLRLAQCDQPLQSYESPNGLKPGRAVVGVRCNGSSPWKIYVPVKIATLQSVVVLKRPLSKGQMIAAADLALVERDTSRLHKRYFSSLDGLVGMRSKRSLQPGKVLTANMLAANQLIKRGGQVEILARAGGLQVRMKGKALESAGRGQPIRVRNKTSGREVTGIVIGPGLVLVQ